MSKSIYYLSLLYAVSCLFMTQEAHAVDLSKVDFSYLYKPSNADFEYQIAEQNGVYQVSVDIKLTKVSEENKVLGFNIFSQRKFNSSKATPVEVLTDYQTTKGNVEQYDYTFKVSDSKHTVLIVTFKFLSRQYYIDIPIQGGLSFPYPDFAYRADSDFQHVVKQEDSITFEVIGRGKQEYFGYLYKDDFKPATTPFSSEYADSDNSFDIERIDASRGLYHVLDKNYLFYFQNDTSSQKGTSFYSQRAYFPENKDFNELIGPLKYISTQQEYEKLSKARNKKMAFDNFWLSMIPSNRLAARTLKNYYKRVREASLLLSTYKDGWKTDRGMIYVIFGPPREVYKSEKVETWVYPGYSGQLTFNFAKMPNLLVGYHYTLERNKKYSNIWYRQVDKWRKGDS